MADEADNGTEPERDGEEEPASGTDDTEEQREPAERADGAGDDEQSGTEDADAGDGTAPDGDGVTDGDPAPDGDGTTDDGADPAGASERDDWSDADLEPEDFVSGGEYVGNDPPTEPAEGDGREADADADRDVDGDGEGGDEADADERADGDAVVDRREDGDANADRNDDGGADDGTGPDDGIHPASNIPPEDQPGSDPDPDSAGIAVPTEVAEEARENADGGDADATDADGEGAGSADGESSGGSDAVQEPAGDGPAVPHSNNLEPGSRPVPKDADRPDNMAEATPIERKTGPAEDQEMPLADHVEEMVARLFVVVAIAGVVSVALFPFGEEVIDLLWYQVLPGGEGTEPRLYHPLALVITQLKVASLAGLIIALPVFVYQTYAFMRPGLYPHERRYYLAAIPTSLVLAFVGVTFAYFVVLPAIFTYFLYYTDTVVTVAFALSDTFNLILLLMGYLAIVFQIPLFIMLAIMMGLTTRRWMENRRLYFWAAFLGISFIFNPDPTGMAPFLVTATMIALFEGTLMLLRWTGR